MILDVESSVVGRVASYVAKQALKGDEINLIKCEKMIITGNKENIKREYLEKRSRVGSSQKGPKYPKTSQRMVKRIIRGMLPNYRAGRGKEAWKRIKCYNGVPKEFEGKEIIQFKKSNKDKFLEVRDISK